MATLNRILFIQETNLKQEPVQSSQLPSTKQQKIPVGTILVLKSYEIPANNSDHYKLVLEDIQFKGLSSNWFAFAKHAKIIQETINPVATIQAIATKQQSKDILKITVDRQSVGNQQGFLKLVFNADTIIKRQPVDSKVLNDQSKQVIPAGTELILLTDKPDTNNIVKFSLQDSHLKFSLKDIEFKGFAQDWYVFTQHVGIEPVD
ncbi:hypothetical protein IQ259_16840 [Fortiea sp. LEGE XX443]|uniref:hypothetical protein n=1 Tax=Fortiea sp. LEGE XX443 TaxID=1828611 RepID=UPI001882F5C0|nr:hypothetical protein [Fortiea sp. LEGE XX443]MBE9006686.1 hypothetical protein [Fortiea sp. LEGE XX443]